MGFHRLIHTAPSQESMSAEAKRKTPKETPGDGGAPGSDAKEETVEEAAKTEEVDEAGDDAEGEEEETMAVDGAVEAQGVSGI